MRQIVLRSALPLLTALLATNACGGGEEKTSGQGGHAGHPGTEPPTDCSTVSDPCPMPSGLTYECQQRFALGINYAWHHFAGDFGGIAAWSQPGVSNQSDVIDAELAEMRAANVSVVRWWMFPDFRGDGVLFDGSGVATGISEGAVRDLHKALELAEKNDLYLVLTLFSFDNFRPTRTEGGIEIRGMSNMVREPAPRSALIEGVVRPVARAVAESPYRRRLLGWDAINEPEWAIEPTGSAPAGGDFDPNEELDPITLSEMRTFIEETLAALGQETPWALRSVGWAAAKWAWALADVAGTDFHQPHIYGWVNDWWPYTQSPASLGYGDKPTVMGEYYLQAMPFGPNDMSTFQAIHQSWYDNGYAGAWSWQYNENKANLELVSAFAADKSCSVSF
jgi:hypothetical protein